MSPAAPAAGADAPDWIVLKFGGTSVSRRHRWDTIGQLMKRRADETALGGEAPQEGEAPADTPIDELL